MSGDVSSSEKVNLNVVHGSKFSVEINLDSSVSEFKDVLVQNLNIPAQQQRLIYKGRVLKDDRTLNSYGLQADHTVHLVCALPAASTNTTVATSGVPVEIPNFGQTQNSDMMRDIMNMPAIQNMMNNGDIVRDLIMSNPQMREVIDRNPELAHILNDPATLRQTLEASRNPELMREMMRNTDRAMSNIEASPEGFNMLRRMYETVQEPLMNATTMAANSGSQTGDISSNSSATGAETTTASLAPNTNPLPNPWSNAGAAGVAQRNTARSTRAGGTPGIGGLSGLGLPNMDQFVPTPAVAQHIRSLLSNPQAMNRVLGPQMQNMLDSNPQLREMMQNPNFVSRLTSPETLQRVSSLQQSLLSFSQQPTTQEPSQTDTGAGGLNNMGLEFWMNMLGFLGAAGVNVPNTPNVPAEQLYANQLSQLQEMGFFDTQENIRALSVTAGNVHAAVERLLGNPGQ